MSRSPSISDGRLIKGTSLESNLVSDFTLRKSVTEKVPHHVFVPAGGGGVLSEIRFGHLARRKYRLLQKCGTKQEPKSSGAVYCVCVEPSRKYHRLHENKCIKQIGIFECRSSPYSTYSQSHCTAHSKYGSTYNTVPPKE